VVVLNHIYTGILHTVVVLNHIYTGILHTVVVLNHIYTGILHTVVVLNPIYAGILLYCGSVSTGYRAQTFPFTFKSSRISSDCALLIDC
jgi:hypothetical protein